MPHPNSISPQAPSRHGFTLVELLGVIAIIGILAGILIPIIGKVQSSGRQTQCASNIRQLALAARLYANDNKGSLPVLEWSGPTYWMYQISPYTGDNVTTGASSGKITPVFQCPSDDLKVAAYQNGSNGFGSVSYLYLLPFPIANRESGNPLKKLQLIENQTTSPAFVDTEQVATDWYNSNAVFETYVKGTRGWIHGTGANVGYWDGHVQFWSNPTWTKIRYLD